MGRQPGHRYERELPGRELAIGAGCELAAYLRGGATQAMFAMTTKFNQPVVAWDVSQVTDMAVRGRPPLCHRERARRVLDGLKRTACSAATRV